MHKFSVEDARKGGKRPRYVIQAQIADIAAVAGVSKRTLREHKRHKRLEWTLKSVAEYVHQRGRLMTVSCHKLQTADVHGQLRQIRADIAVIMTALGIR